MKQGVSIALNGRVQGESEVDLVSVTLGDFVFDGLDGGGVRGRVKQGLPGCGGEWGDRGRQLRQNLRLAEKAKPEPGQVRGR